MYLLTYFLWRTKASRPCGQWNSIRPTRLRPTLLSVCRRQPTDLQVGVLWQSDAVSVLAEPLPNKPQLTFRIHRRSYVLDDRRVVHVRVQWAVPVIQTRTKSRYRTTCRLSAEKKRKRASRHFTVTLIWIDLYKYFLLFWLLNVPATTVILPTSS